MNQTPADLREDLDTLAALAESCGARLFAFRSALDADPYLSEQSQTLWSALQELIKQLRQADPTPELKRAAAERLRLFHGQLGFLLAAPDWQSPTFLHSLHHQAGKQEGRIIGTENDYKRDMHLDAFAYEREFCRAYVDSTLRFTPKAYVTSSGMAAFTTLVGLLQLVYKLRGPILVGRNSYFENRWILERAFPAVHLVDEMDTNVILEAARRLRPRAVFLDTYCNTAEVAMPDLPSLLPPLGRLLGPRGILVLDNSALGPSCQPLRYLAHLGGPRLFVIESLNKFHQFGMDRVTGGIIWTQGGAPSGLLKTREHLGTNMPDASVLSLPAPNRALLERRLHRLGRNALDLASRLQTFADQHPHGALSHVIYPGLPSHPAHAWARSLPFPGAFFALAFKPTHQNVYFYKSFLARIMDEARRQNVQLVAGTSFGLDTTRLYLTALHATRLTSPFLRLSVGTETADEIENIARVFTTILSKV